MPKLALAVNAPSHGQSSHSSGGMAWASLDDEDTWEDDFQTPHMPVHHVVQGEDGGCRELVNGRMEASRRSPGWQQGYQVDIGEEETTLETINPTWRPTRWLQLAVQGISDHEVPWYELVIPLTVGAEGTALLLAKHLLAVWRWSIKVIGEGVCPPTLTALNIGQFMTREEVAEGVGEPHWFVVYSCALQWVGEAACRQKWEWPVRETLEVKVSPLVHAFWEETGTDLTVACVKLCWEPTPRGIFCKREEGPVAHVITFMDELAIRVPSLDAWDQFVWLPAAVMLWALMEAEPYGYCHGQAVDLRPVMPVAQFRVTDKVGTYLCVARALAFKGSVLVYNPTKNKVDWVPVRGLTNNLTWAKERSMVALANYVPHIPDEVAQIVGLGSHQLVSWPKDSSTSEEEGDAQDPRLLTTDTNEWGEDGKNRARLTDLKEGMEPDRRWCSQDWEAVMEGSQGPAYDDLRSDSDATMTGAGCPWGATSSPSTQGLGTLCMKAVEVHVSEAELEGL